MSVLNITPIAIGKSTIFKISIKRPLGSIGINLPARNKKITGVRSGAKNVFTLDTVTDNAVSPLDKNVITFDAVPLGQHPTRIKPAASSGESLRSNATENATPGITKYLIRMPNNTSSGLVRTNLKSSRVSVSPIPSIMIPNSHGIHDPYGLKGSGNKNATAAKITTHNGNNFVIQLKTLSKNFIYPPFYLIFCYKKNIIFSISYFEIFFYAEIFIIEI